MSKKLAAKTLLALGLFTIPRSVFAHHGAAGYDNGKTITLTGTVTKYDWSPRLSGKLPLFPRGGKRPKHDGRATIGGSLAP